jgi:hypothetical protein
MKPANASPRGTPHARIRPSGESHTRLLGAPTPSAPNPPPATERGRWGRCEEDTPAPAAQPAIQSASAEEPRTGIVRRVSSRPSPAVVRPAPELAVPGERESQPAGSSGEWRCLEVWSRPSKERRQRRNAKVTIVQLSKNGDLIRQNGPDAWLPEAGDFVQRMSQLLAQGLGFERCRSVCLKGASSALTVTEAGDTKVVVVNGPVRSMANVLRRAGLE